MKYNFDEVIPRRGSNSIKWDTDSSAEMLPMWIADMDFRLAPKIKEAVERRLAQGVFGYAHIPDAFYDAIINWFDRRHKVHVEREWILYTIGVVPAIATVIHAMTKPGDGILIQPPVYNCFFNCIEGNNRRLVSNPLRYENGRYSVDWEDLERKAADPNVKMMIICNPHNPAGRVWTREELLRMGEICMRNNVFILSDEIHCELMSPGFEYTPFASLSEELRMHSAFCASPSKAFNLAGFQVANIFAPNKEVHDKIEAVLHGMDISSLNCFAVEALIAAYNESEDWLDELNAYIYDNYLFMKDFVEREMPDLYLVPLEGTYLGWLDCQVLHMTSNEMIEQLKRDYQLWLNAGTMYGPEGDGFLRWNLACPRVTLEEGLNRFLKFYQDRKK